MKKVLLSQLVFAFFLSNAISQYDNSKAELLGWKLCSQAYTFKEFTFAETLDKLSAMGVKYVEAYKGQEIGAGISGKMHYSMNASTIKQVKSLLDKKGITLINFGVVRGKDEAEWRSIFEFSKTMNIQTINAEAEFDQIDIIEKLADEYEINVAFHNHPIPSRYWHPDIIVNQLKDRSKRLGACADLGHWVRSGLNPVECVKKLEGRILSLHIKDLNTYDRQAHDVPWGTGVCNVSGVLHELKRQNFKGVFSIEYEYNWKDSFDEIKEGVDYFNRVCYWLTKE